jgi:hypothetical protein
MLQYRRLSLGVDGSIAATSREATDLLRLERLLL